MYSRDLRLCARSSLFNAELLWLMKFEPRVPLTSALSRQPQDA